MDKKRSRRRELSSDEERKLAKRLRRLEKELKDIKKKRKSRRRRRSTSDSARSLSSSSSKQTFSDCPLPDPYFGKDLHTGVCKYLQAFACMEVLTRKFCVSEYRKSCTRTSKGHKLVSLTRFILRERVRTFICTRTSGRRKMLSFTRFSV